jgi:hypothetical protein
MLAYAVIDKRAIREEVRALAQKMMLRCRAELQELEKLYHGESTVAKEGAVRTEGPKVDR